MSFYIEVIINDLIKRSSISIMEEDNQEHSLYKLLINILGQAIIYLSISLLQIFIIINTKPSIKMIFNKSYEFNSS